MARIWPIVLLLVMSGPNCSGDDDEDGTYACRYNESTSFICSGYSDYSDDEHCVEVSSTDRCDSITESYNDCTGGCCTDTSYYDVSVTPGTCEDEPESGDSVDTGSGGSSGGSESTSGSGGSNDIDICTALKTDTDCGVCLKSWCCPEMKQCVTSSCPDLTSCITDCDDDACLSDCEQSYPEAVEPFNDLFDCSTKHCETECNS